MDNFEFCKLLLSIDFWSALTGFFGALLIFFFGLPPRLDIKGHINLITEQIDQDETTKAKCYKQISYSGVFLLTISFALQLIKLF